LVVWPGRAVTVGQVSPVVWGVASEGDGVRRPPNRPPLEDGVEKNSVCFGVRRHVAYIAGLRI